MRSPLLVGRERCDNVGASLMKQTEGERVDGRRGADSDRDGHPEYQSGCRVHSRGATSAGTAWSAAVGGADPRAASRTGVAPVTGTANGFGPKPAAGPAALPQRGAVFQGARRAPDRAHAGGLHAYGR